MAYTYLVLIQESFLVMRSLHFCSEAFDAKCSL